MMFPRIVIAAAVGAAVQCHWHTSQLVGGVIALGTLAALHVAYLAWRRWRRR